MSWLYKHKRSWRLVSLILLGAAAFGPWAFDRINVPAQYPCSYRLEGDFCGIPLSGIWMLFWLGAFFSGLTVGMVTGITTLRDLIPALFALLSVLVFILPFFSTLLLLWRGNQGRWQIFPLIVWCLAIVSSVLLGTSGFLLMPRWALWGLWLYLGLAFTMVILEISVLLKNHQLDRFGEPDFPS